MHALRPVPHAVRTTYRSHSNRRVRTVHSTVDFIPAVMRSNLPTDVKGKLLQSLVRAEVEVKEAQKEVCKAQKEVSEAQKEVSEAQKEVSEAQKEVCKAQAAAKVSQLELEKKQLEQLMINAELLRTRGLLDMRGAFELSLQQRLLFTPAPAKKLNTCRQKLVHLLSHNDQLLECLKRCMHDPSDDINEVARRVDDLYRHLCTQIHRFPQTSATVVDLMEGPLNKEQIDILECMIRDIVPYNIVLLHRNSIDSSDDADEDNSQCSAADTV